MDLEPDLEEPIRRPGLIAVLHRHRRPLTVLAILWFAGLMVGGIFLSQLDARLGLNLFGPRVYVVGEPAVVRVALRELRFDRLRPLTAAEVRLERDDGTVAGPWPLTTVAGDLVQGTIVPPSPGSWRLVVTAPVDEVVLLLAVPIQVLPNPPPLALAAAPKHAPPPRADQGPILLDAHPTDHLLAAGFPTRLTLRAMDAQGHPAADVPVRLELQEGRTALPLPPEVRTGPNGLVEVPVLPQHPIFWLNLAVVAPPEAPPSAPTTAPEVPAAPAPEAPAPPSEAPPAPASEAAPPATPVPLAATSSATRRLKHAPTQFMMVTGEAVVQPGAQLAVGVKSLHRTGPIFVDVWQGDRWLASMPAELADGEARFFLTLPTALPQDPALLWIQAYRTPYLPGPSRGGTYVLATRQPPEVALRAFAGQLAATGHDPLFTAYEAGAATNDPVLARYLLGLPDRPVADPPLLTDTSESARQTVASLKGTWQRRFVVALVASGVLMFGLMLVLLLLNTREVQRRWDAADGGEAAVRGTRFVREAILLFAILAVFIVALIQLVLVIRW